MTLREAIEQARDALPEGEARNHIEALLVQKVDNGDTLIDECSMVIYG